MKVKTIALLSSVLTIMCFLVANAQVTTDNITFTGKIEMSGAPVSGAEVTVINKTLDKPYGIQVTNDLGEYSVQYFEGFNIPVASGGDEISVVVNGKEQETFILENENLVPPYIIGVETIAIPPTKLTVTGMVRDVELTLVHDDDGLSVKVANPSKEVESSSPTENGIYSAVLEKAGEVVAEPGDEIVVTVSDADGNEVGREFHIFTIEDMESPSITVNVNTDFMPPLGSVVEINNIIIEGVIYESDGVTPAPNVEVVVKNETKDIIYGVTSADDSGAYNVKFFKDFEEIIATTGDKISFTVNGIEEKIYTLKDINRDLVPPYIVTVDVLLTGIPTEITLIEPKGPIQVIADGRSTVPITFGLKDENGKPVTNWTDIDITVEPPIGTVSPAIETDEKGIYTATYTVGMEKAVVTLTIAAGEAAPVSFEIELLAGLIVEGNVLEADGTLLAPGVPAVAIVTHDGTGLRHSEDIINGRYTVQFLEDEKNQMAEGDSLIIEIKSVDETILFGSGEHILTQAEIDSGFLTVADIMTNRVSDFTIKGRVTDAQGNPIEDAVVSALSGETSTDVNGEYTLVLTDYPTNPVAGQVVEVSVTTDIFAVVQKRKTSFEVDDTMLQNRGVENIDFLITPIRIGGLTLDTTQAMNLIDKAVRIAGVPVQIRTLVADNPQYEKMIIDMINSMGAIGSLVPLPLLIGPLDAPPKVFAQWQNMDLENFGNPIVPYPLLSPEFLEALTSEFAGNLSLKVVGNKLDLYLIAPEYADDVSFESGLGTPQIERVEPGQTSITHRFQLEEELALTLLPAWPGMTEADSFSAFSGVTLYYASVVPGGEGFEHIIVAPEDRDDYASVSMTEQIIDGKVVWTASPELELGKKHYYFFEVELKQPFAAFIAGEELEVSRWVMPDPRNIQGEDRVLFTELFDQPEWQIAFTPIANALVAGQPIPEDAIPPVTDYLTNRSIELIADVLDPTSDNYLDPRIVSEFKTPSVPAGESLWLANFDVDATDGNYEIAIDVIDSAGDSLASLSVPIGVDRRVAPGTFSISSGQNTIGYLREDDNAHVFAKEPGVPGVSTLELNASLGRDAIGVVFQVLPKGGKTWSTSNPVLALVVAIVQNVDPELAARLARGSPSPENVREVANLLNEADPAIQQLYDNLSPAAQADFRLLLEVLGQLIADPTDLTSLQQLLSVTNFNELATLGTKMLTLDVSPIAFFDKTQIMILPKPGDYWVRAVPFDDVLNVETSDVPTKISVVPAEPDIAKITQISLDANADGDIDDPYEKGDYSVEPPELYTIFFVDDEKATLTASVTQRTGNPFDVAFQYALSTPDDWQEIETLTWDEVKGKDTIDVDWMFDDALKAEFESLFEANPEGDNPLVFVRAVATNALGLTDPEPYVADVLLGDVRIVLPEALAFGVESPEINADSGAPMGTVMLNAYTSTRTIPDIDHILFEISSDDGATWSELGQATTFAEVGPEEVGVLQSAVEDIASGKVGEVGLLKAYNKWTLEWYTKEGSKAVDDTIMYHPDAAPEEDEGRDYTKDENFPPGPYIVRVVTVDTEGVRQDERPDEPKAPVERKVSVDNVDDVPPLMGTHIVNIRREEDIGVFSDNLLPAEEVEVYARVKITAKPVADPTTFDKVVLLIESEDGTFSQEYTLDKNYSIEIDTWAEEIPNGRYIFQALAVDAIGNREVRDMTFAQKVTITNVVPPTLADISLVQVAGMPITPITLEASVDLRPISGESVINVVNVQASMASMLVSANSLMWDVPADVNLGDPSIVANIEGEPIEGGGFTFAWDATSLKDGQYFISFIFRASPPVVIQNLMNIATIVDNTDPEISIVAPIAGSTLGFRPVVWVKYQGTGSEIYAVNLELKDASGNTVLTPGVAEGAIEGQGAAAVYVKPSLDENGFSIDDAKLVYKVPEVLEAGGYTAIVAITDLARNVAEAEVSFAVGQDASPPIIAVTSPHGTITVSEVTLSISVVDDTGVASFTLKLNGVEIPAEDVELVDGVITSKVTDLNSGEQQVEVEVVDKAGNKASAKWSFIVEPDATPPQISVVSPQGVIRKSEATIAVAATDESGIDSVSIKLDDVEVPDVVLADGIATAQVSDLTEGEHQVSVEVVDKAGNKANAMWTFTVELDTTPPQITVVSPLGVVRSSSAKITVSATDESGIADVAINLNGADVTDVQLANGVATAEVTDLSLGEQQVEVVVTDGAGNEAQTAWSFTVELDTTPPQITVTSPQGTVYGDSATISATVTDESGIDGNPTITVDGNSLTVTFNNGVATANATGLSAGEHQVEVTATDNAGNTVSAQWSFTVDSTPPQITAVSPQGTIYSDSATISATITDESGIDGNPTITVDGNSLTVTFSDGVATANATGLERGEHQVEVTATDNAGNTASAQWSFTFLPDTNGPAITAVSPLGTVRVEKPTISVAVSDDVSGVDSIDITLKDAAGKEIDSSSDSSFQPNSALKRGTYIVTAEAEDNAGNSSSVDWNFTVEFDQVPPVITIVSPQDGARTTEVRPMISATYSDNLAGVDETSVALTVDDQNVTGKAKLKNASQIVYEPDSDLSLGPHTVVLEVKDNDDNEASVTWSFIVEADTAVIMNPRNYPNPFQSDTTIAFTLTKQSQVTIRIFDFSGRLVKTLKDDEIIEAGPQKITWDGKTENGDDLARGVYLGLIIMKTELEPQRAVFKMALTR